MTALCSGAHWTYGWATIVIDVKVLGHSSPTPRLVSHVARLLFPIFIRGGGKRVWLPYLRLFVL